MFTHTSNRNWNKNRRAVSPTCIGVDLNRNFQYQFLGSSDVNMIWQLYGASDIIFLFSQPCSENYSGPYFHSEAESRAVRDILLRYQSQARLFLSLQAFGQQITIPYNYIAVGSQNQAALLNLGNQAAAAIRTAPSQRSYAVGVGGLLNGVQSGTSLDYAYETIRVPLSFTLRLPRGGTTGWDVLQSEISAMVSEAFRGFLVFARHVATS